MASRENTQIRLASRPKGMVTLDNFAMAKEPVASITEGQVLVRNLYMSVDPYMRGRMNDVKSYVPPFQIGKVMQAGVVGEILESKNNKFAEGDIVSGMLGWETYSISDGKGLQKLVIGSAPLSYHLGILGMPGMTAYVGLVGIGKVQAGESVFVSAASGAVGSIVGQLAKILGCHVAGCASTDDKVALMKSEFGYDTGFNYTTSKSIPDSIREVCPKGIDVDFENVGGPIFEAALWNMNNFGRIALCGMIANYNDQQLQPGPRGMASIIGKRLTIRGFIVGDEPALCREYIEKATKWIETGELKYRETVAKGIGKAPQAFIDLLNGKNVGKQIVKLADR